MDQQCRASGNIFPIDAIDQAFYAKLGVPAPTLCPPERMRRRWAWRGKDFYIRRCDGCKQPTMSWTPTEVTDVALYCEDCFRKDDFDARIYGRPFDFTRPFFEQFMELYRVVPKHASNAMQNENCNFIVSSHQNKNCYMTDETDYSRDCLFGYTIQSCADIVEALYVHHSEIGYRLSKAENCHTVFFSQNVFSCSDSAFLQNCRACRHCIGCANLYQAEYHVFNEPVSKAEYERIWSEIFSGDPALFAAWEEKLQRFLTEQFAPAVLSINCENSDGNYLTNCNAVQGCFFVDNSRDCRYCTDIHYSSDCYDVNIYEGELLYESLHVGPKAYRNLFCMMVWYSSNVCYSADSYNLRDCFGVVGLKNERYAVLNVTYPESEYEALVRKIISHMRDTGEWGEFFPMEYSPIPYNRTMAQRFFPLTEAEARSRGVKWSKEERLESSAALHLAPQTAGEVTDVSKIYRCEASGRPFRYTAQEIAFYQRFGLPLPRVSPQVRVERLWLRLGERSLEPRICASCNIQIQSALPHGHRGPVYCLDCYRQKAYGALDERQAT
jgi:hypothetical protein